MATVSEMIGIELKLGSKDPLLAQIWLSIELVLFQHCMLGVRCLWPH
jgi:hypothetical protein